MAVNTKSTKEKLLGRAQGIQGGNNPNQEPHEGSQVPEKKQAGATFADFLKGDKIQLRFNEILQNRAPQYLTSLLGLYNNDPKLRECDPVSIVQAGMIAATLDLPIEKNFGYAWILPYWNNKANKRQAQFQMGYKGYIQLALRSREYEKINVITVYEGEKKHWNKLTEEFIFDPDGKVSDKVEGYAAYFKLKDGYNKTVYWSKERVEAHRIEFSKDEKPEVLKGVWKKNYDAMAMKTVLNFTLKNWGILSTELRTAIMEEEQEPERARKIIDLDDYENEGTLGIEGA